MDSKLEQAKEWASRITSERARALNTPLNEKAFAAAEVIQSLPDTVVDGDKLREVINKVLANTIHGTVGHQVAEDYAALIGELIPAPPLPTLADMTPEERQACRWMQADVKLSEGSSVTCVIADPRLPGAKVRVWAPHGGSDDVEEGRVTPLPDLPKLEWPGNHADTITAESVEDVQAGRVADFEPALPRPEDAPEGEVWMIRLHENADPVPAFRVHASKYGPGKRWAHYRVGGSMLGFADDEYVTLVSRLVPERKENA